MFRRSILGLLAATGAAALGAAAYTIYKQKQEEETAAPEEVQDDEVRFVDITNEEPETAAETPAEEVKEEAAPEEPLCEEVPAEEPVPEEPACEEAPAEEPVPEEPACEEVPAEEPVPGEVPAEEIPAEPVTEVSEAEALRDMDFDLGEDVPAEEVPAEEPAPEEEPAAEETPAEEPVSEEVPAEEPAVETVQPEEELNEETPAADAEENTAELDLGFGTLGEKEEEPEAAVAEKPYLSEVEQIAALYQYLDKDFVEEMYLRNSQFSEQFPADTLIRISHKCRYEDSEIMREFEKIAVNNGYAAEELNDHETVVSRKMFTEEGSILSDIFNVANQVAALQGNYEGYRID